MLLIDFPRVQYNLFSRPVGGLVGMELTGYFGKRNNVFGTRVKHILLHLRAPADIHLGVHNCCLCKSNLPAVNTGAIEIKACCV
ncbi:hypothetical protein D3C73_1493580 [compost metagenome]